MREEIPTLSPGVILFSRQAHESTDSQSPLFLWGAMQMSFCNVRLVPILCFCLCQLLPCAPEQPWGYVNGCRKWNFKTLQLLCPVPFISWGLKERRPSIATARGQRACPTMWARPCCSNPRALKSEKGKWAMSHGFLDATTPVAINPSSNSTR